MLRPELEADKRWHEEFERQHKQRREKVGWTPLISHLFGPGLLYMIGTIAAFSLIF